MLFPLKFTSFEFRSFSTSLSILNVETILTNCLFLRMSCFTCKSFLFNQFPISYNFSTISLEYIPLFVTGVQENKIKYFTYVHPRFCKSTLRSNVKMFTKLKAMKRKSN